VGLILRLAKQKYQLYLNNEIDSTFDCVESKHSQHHSSQENMGSLKTNHPFLLL